MVSRIVRGHVMAPPFPLSNRASDVRPGCRIQRIAPTLRQVADLVCARTKVYMQENVVLRIKTNILQSCLKSYLIVLQYAVNRAAASVQADPGVNLQQSARYTDKLIGEEYLMAQTDQPTSPLSHAGEEEEELPEDGVPEEEEEDPTIPLLPGPSTASFSPPATFFPSVILLLALFTT
ncbi:hypothetical protein PoB_007348800 [Plakobranchus ocellatus]|uniref:Uncharacterized protein n=1 Tax=Plakobranchus ocellatus TaxID=259542 RepID=A0AAV4DRS0_9GAST|nr:hypothetical protein PoB_007348800 [Plakobranchus ocellatus]